MKKYCLVPLCAIGGLLAATAMAQNSYTFHEWGTFTDVQGADGQLLSWHPLQTSELPAFVRDWRDPGMNRRFAGVLGRNGPFISKVMMITLQRMETPVMYFYSDNDLAVDVAVDFPGGVITEWYPQATQIGPSVAANTNASAAATLPVSRAAWKHLWLLPESQHHDGLPSRLAPETSGNHYFAARATRADTVRVDGEANGPAEYEKFIFYRGAGNFQTPLRVSVDKGDQVIVQNTGDQPLAHLFLVEIKDGAGSFRELKQLLPGEHKTVVAPEVSDPMLFSTTAEGEQKLGTAMHAALVDTGLFDDEATAMVNTWKDSWFAEDGVRVLYLLPRAWADQTLPLTLDPRPEKTVRVMVGRAEVIMPKTASDLDAMLTRAMDGDAAARDRAMLALKKLGRFADPALQLAYRKHSEDFNQFGFGLLRDDGSSK